MRDGGGNADSVGGELLFVGRDVLFGVLYDSAASALTQQSTVEGSTAEAKPQDLELVVGDTPAGGCIILRADQSIGDLLRDHVEGSDDRQAIEQIASLVARLAVIDDIHWLICKCSPEALSRGEPGVVVRAQNTGSQCALRYIGSRSAYVAPVVAGELGIAIFPRRDGRSCPDAVDVLANGKPVGRVDLSGDGKGAAATVALPLTLLDGRPHRISLRTSPAGALPGAEDFEWTCPEPQIRFGRGTRGRPLPASFPPGDVEIVDRYLDVALEGAAPTSDVASSDVADRLAEVDRDTARQGRICLFVVASTLDDFNQTPALTQLIQRYAAAVHVFLPTREAVVFARELCRSSRLDQLVNFHSVEQLGDIISVFDDREVIVLAPPRTRLDKRSLEMIDGVCSGASDVWVSVVDTAFAVSGRICTVRRRRVVHHTLAEDAVAVFSKRAAAWTLKKVEGVHDGVRKARYVFDGVPQAGGATRFHTDDAADLVLHDPMSVFRVTGDVVPDGLLQVVEYCRLSGTRVKIVCLIALAKRLEKMPEIVASQAELLGSDLVRSERDFEMLCRQLSSLSPVFAFELPAMEQIKSLLPADALGKLLKKIALHVAGDAVCIIGEDDGQAGGAFDAAPSGPRFLCYRTQPVA